VKIMAEIAFLGLGNMGTPMAERLLQAGHDVTVWNRTAERAAPLAAAGAVVAASPAEAAKSAEFAITMLANPQALDEVLFGSRGLAWNLSPGQMLVDMSTVGPGAFRSAAARLPTGVTAVDAPVSGSVPQANSGELRIYVGADDESFERVRPVLEVLGEVHHAGPPGAGAAMKLVLNSTLTASIVALGEALVLAQVLGLDQRSVLDVLEDSSIGPTVRAKRANIEAGRYPPSFKLSLAAKDIRLALAAADEAGADLMTAATVRQWLDEAARQGAADLDFSAVVATIVGESHPPPVDISRPSGSAERAPHHSDPAA
jgi:3-hydroxyisobutyrate dehydrogenase-like beta-hydroxyacid dehydrogenase